MYTNNDILELSDIEYRYFIFVKKKYTNTVKTSCNLFFEEIKKSRVQVTQETQFIKNTRLYGKKGEVIFLHQ